jgi:hypothetical protein
VNIGLSGFKTPLEFEKLKAWSMLILLLIFREKGSCPSDPNMGVGINSYEFTFMDTAIDQLTSEMNDQVRTYLPDIPVENIEVAELRLPTRPDPILTISLDFSHDDMEEYMVMVAKINTRIIDFDIAI